MPTFKNEHRKTVESFLNSVVIVDDNVDFESVPLNEEGEAEEKLELQAREGFDYTGEAQSDFSADELREFAVVASETSLGEASSTQNEGEDGICGTGEPLEASVKSQTVVNKFSENGINCVVHKYIPGSDLSSGVKSLIKKSDIAIFDWKLDPSNLEVTPGLLKDLLLEEGSGNFKYIVIYTNENVDSVKESLKAALEPECGQVYEDGDNIDVSYEDGHVSYRITIVKKGVDSQLCDMVLNEFSKCCT